MSTFVLTLLYSLPLILFFIVAWLVQSKLHKTIDDNMSVETTIQAEKVLQMVLNENNISIPIERGTDYTQNDYDEMKQKILLSPNTMGQTDLTSIGHALHAAGSAIFTRTEPQTHKQHKTLIVTETIIFWIVFCVLAFGLMSCSVPVVILGYLSALVPAFLRFYLTRQDVRRNEKLLKDVATMKIFDDQQVHQLGVVLRAIALRY